MNRTSPYNHVTVLSPRKHGKNVRRECPGCGHNRAIALFSGIICTHCGLVIPSLARKDTRP